MSHLKTKLQIAGGSLLAILGLLLVSTYVWEAVIVPWGQPDQSLLYWYLVFLLAGLGLLKAGAILIVTGRQGREPRG